MSHTVQRSCPLHGVFSTEYCVDCVMNAIEGRHRSAQVNQVARPNRRRSYLMLALIAWVIVIFVVIAWVATPK